MSRFASATISTASLSSSIHPDSTGLRVAARRNRKECRQHRRKRPPTRAKGVASPPQASGQRKSGGETGTQESQRGLQTGPARGTGAAIGRRLTTITRTPSTGRLREREYLLRREVATSHLVQAKVDLAERDAVSGRLKDARKELIAAAISIRRTGGARTPDGTQRARTGRATAVRAEGSGTGGRDSSATISREQETSTFAATRRAHMTKWRSNLASRWRSTWICARGPSDFQVNDVDFPTAMRLLGDMTGTFWRPLAPRSFS